MEPKPFVPMSPEEYQANQDKQQLDLLVVLWYVNMVFGLMPGCLGAVYGSMGSLFAFLPTKGTTSGDVMITATIFGGMGIVLLAVSVLLIGLSFFAARSIRDRKNLTFVMVVSALNCLHMPLGTGLGVFTFIVTSRPTVKALFR
ncbi:MAG: hypothetical protein JST30_11930 [Armatimonadetes bacterium]|nr:hypothetical protein [Armatimonadota bacterium]